MTIGQVVLSVFSTSLFASLIAMIYQASRPESLILVSAKYDRKMKWWQKAYFAAAAIALGVCLFKGAESFLYWLPAGWGSYDEEGDFYSSRSSIAGLFSLIGAFSLFNALVEGANARFAIRLMSEKHQGEQKIQRATHTELTELASAYRSRAQKYRDMAKMRSESPNVIEREYITLYVELASLAENASERRQ